MIKQLSNNWYYTPQIIVANTCKRLLRFCVHYYGGRVVKKKKYKRKHATAYQWLLTGNKMRFLLSDVLPYLIVKDKQAKIVLSFPKYNKGGNKSRTDAEKQEQKNLWLAIKKLNGGLSDKKKDKRS